MYIVFEWVVGTGKSTQSKRLQTYLQEKFPDKVVHLLREPGGTEIAEAIRTLVQATEFEEEMHPMTDAYLYASARAQLLHGVIKPALDKGDIVISDRNVCSSLAYQWRTQWLGIDKVWEINASAVEWVLPDYTLFMDMDVAMGLARTFDTEGDKRERKKQDFFDKVHAWYEELFSFAPVAETLHRIDAGWTIEEVEQRIHKTLDI